MVIAIHTTSWSIAHLTDAAVPFFFIVSGFLLFRKLTNSKEEDLLTIRSWTLRVFKMYLIWSAVYLPFAVYGFWQDGLDLKSSVILYLRNFLLVGENYLSWPLWYLLGMVWCGIIFYVLRGLNVPVWVMLILGLALAVAAQVFNLDDVPAYTKLFKTTRNGLFCGLLYMASGGMVAEYLNRGKLPYDKNVSLPYFLAAVALFIGLQFSTHLLWPFAVSLFLFCLAWPFNFPDNAFSSWFGSMSRTIYLVHMIFAGLFTIAFAGKTPQTVLFIMVSIFSFGTAVFALLRHNRTHIA